MERTSPGITDLLVQELVTRMAGQTMSERDVESAIDNMKGWVQGGRVQGEGYRVQGGRVQ